MVYKIFLLKKLGEKLFFIIFFLTKNIGNIIQIFSIMIFINIIVIYGYYTKIDS